MCSFETRSVKIGGLNVGRHGIITPDQARREAKRILAEVTFGRDPSEEKRQYREMLTVQELAEQYIRRLLQGA